MGKNMFKFPSPKVIMLPSPTAQQVPTPQQVFTPQLAPTAAPAGSKPAGEGGGASFLGSTVIPPGMGGGAGGGGTPGEKKLLGQ